MTKAFEEHKRLLESEKEQLILLHQILSPSSTTVNDNNENLEKHQRRHVTVENKLVMSK